MRVAPCKNKHNPKSPFFKGIMNQLITVLQIGSIFVLLLLPAFLTKQWWLFTLFIGFGIAFGIVEITAIVKSGLSISQHFWVLKETHPKDAIVVTSSMALGWSILIYHFMVHK